MLSFIPIITLTDNKGHLKLGSTRADCPTGLYFTCLITYISCYFVSESTVTWCDAGKYCDAEDSSRVPNSGDFVPFTRTSEVLDPTHAESPLPVSREPTDMVRARRAYQREMNPAKYGHAMDRYAYPQVCWSACFVRD